VVKFRPDAATLALFSARLLSVPRRLRQLPRPGENVLPAAAFIR
jgi:hypothetical protein